MERMQMVLLWRAAALVSTALVVAVVKAETVYEALGTHRELSKFYQMVNRDEVLRTLLKHWPATVFAPTNKAFEVTEDWDAKTEGKVASYHVVNMVAKKTSFPLPIITTLAGAPPIYLGVKESPGNWQEKEYFVNNGKITRAESFVSQEGSEQILYVIDRVLRPYLASSSSLPNDAMHFIESPDLYGIQEKLSGFESQIKKEGLENLFELEGNHTYFVPVGSLFGAPNAPLSQQIDSWVVKGHVVPKHVIFTRLAGQESYPSVAFDADMKVEISIVTETRPGSHRAIYAQSNTVHSEYGHKKGVVPSRIVRANIPVKNGVLHLVESPLMVIDITVLKYLENEKGDRFSEFLNLLNYSPEFKEELMSSQEKTLFAPSNEAIRQLPRETVAYLKRNSSAMTEVLKLHLVMSSISTEDILIGSPTEHLSANRHNSLKFRVVGSDHNKTLIVEGNGVKATAIQSDIAAVDGMVHVVDRFLGMPFQTVHDRLQSESDLRITSQLSEQDEWSSFLDRSEERFTFFAPNNEAWQYVQHHMPTEYKQLTSGDIPYHVQKILDRHLIVGSEIKLEDMDQSHELQMVHGKFKIQREVSYEGDGFVVEWEGIEARVIRPDVQAVNGVIHVLDRVMMKKRDLTKSTATKVSVSSSYALSVIILLHCTAYYF